MAVQQEQSASKCYARSALLSMDGTILKPIKWNDDRAELQDSHITMAKSAARMALRVDIKHHRYRREGSPGWHRGMSVPLENAHMSINHGRGNLGVGVCLYGLWQGVELWWWPSSRAVVISCILVMASTRGTCTTSPVCLRFRHFIYAPKGEGRCDIIR